MLLPEEQERALRLKDARIKAGWISAAAFAKAHSQRGINENTYRVHETGGRNFKSRTARIYAELLGTTYDWLWTGYKVATGISSVLTVGEIRKGRTITATHPLIGSIIMKPAKKGAHHTVDVPPQGDPSSLFAITIQNSDFAPYFKPGTIIYYNRTPHKPSDCIGEMCVIKIKDGDTVFDILHHGSEKNVYDIPSQGRNLEIEWCVKYSFSRNP